MSSGGRNSVWVWNKQDHIFRSQVTFVKLSALVLHFCLTRYTFLTKSRVSPSAWCPPPLSVCPQSHLKAPPLSPECTSAWVRVTHSLRPIFTRSLHPNPNGRFSIPTFERNYKKISLSEGMQRFDLKQRSVWLTLGWSKRGSFAAPGCQLMQDLHPEFFCRTAVPLARQMPP